MKLGETKDKITIKVSCMLYASLSTYFTVPFLMAFFCLPMTRSVIMSFKSLNILLKDLL
jgi:hypothetical protein